MSDSSGAWHWDRDNDCIEDRWGAGWAVDWNDEDQPGNPVGDSGYDVGALAGNSYNSADNAVHCNNGSKCKATGNDGNWGSATHIYAPGTTEIEACVFGSGPPSTGSSNSNLAYAAGAMGLLGAGLRFLGRRRRTA